MYQTILLKDRTTVEVQHILNHVIAPRPICFASTMDRNGNVNLSPFSYFNLFSVNPPVVIFSPSRRVRDTTIKHTLENLQEVGEVAISIVTYDMVQQVSLASSEFPKGVDEFVKAGFTKEPSCLIQPPRVHESDVQLECRVLDIQSLGTGAGAGNLVMAEILMIHLNEKLFGPDGKLDQERFDYVARLGGNWYARIHKENMFSVEKPNTKIAIGIDRLPESIRNSSILTGNHLGQLANVYELPAKDESFEDERLKTILESGLNIKERENELHLYAVELLNRGKRDEAWQVLLATEQHR